MDQQPDKGYCGLHDLDRSRPFQVTLRAWVTFVLLAKAVLAIDLESIAEVRLQSQTINFFPEAGSLWSL